MTGIARVVSVCWRPLALIRCDVAPHGDRAAVQHLCWRGTAGSSCGTNCYINTVYFIGVVFDSGIRRIVTLPRLSAYIAVSVKCAQGLSQHMSRPFPRILLTAGLALKLSSLPQVLERRLSGPVRLRGAAGHCLAECLKDCSCAQALFVLSPLTDVPLPPATSKRDERAIPIT